jgi:hypothetical protein
MDKIPKSSDDSYTGLSISPALQYGTPSAIEHSSSQKLIFCLIA